MVYPSLCDNNIFQRTLVSEVLYRAEQQKKEWLESQEGEPCDLQTMGEEMYRQGSWVCVPLLRVWAGSRVQALCRNIQQLRDVLLVDSQVRLDAERDAIMLPHDYEEEGKEEEMDEGEKAEHVLVLQFANNNAEDWESELFLL